MESTVKPVLLVDVMSTLVYDPFYQEMPAFFGLSLEELMRAKHPTAWTEFEKGHWTEQQFLDSFFADGRSFDHEGFKAVTFRAYRWLPGMEELLVELSKAGVFMHIMSNYPLWYLEIDRRLGLSRYLPWSFVSCDWGLRKPNPQAFTRLLAYLQVLPAGALFIDDNGVNCDTATNCGIPSVRFRDAKTLRRELVNRQIL